MKRLGALICLAILMSACGRARRASVEAPETNRCFLVKGPTTAADGATLCADGKTAKHFTTGDIILAPLSSPAPESRMAAAKDNIMSFGLWQGTVPYEIDPALPFGQRKDIERVIREMNELQLGVILAPREAETDYVRFALDPSATECSSFIGRVGGRQDIIMTKECGRSTIRHEIGHALGLQHEFQRADRGKYLVVHWENVLPDRLESFAKITGVTGIGDFDPASIMMYPASAYSANGSPTLRLTDLGKQLGELAPDIDPNRRFSTADIKGLQKLYRNHGEGSQVAEFRQKAADVTCLPPGGQTPPGQQPIPLCVNVGDPNPGAPAGISAPCVALVVASYQKYLGRTPNQADINNWGGLCSRSGGQIAENRIATSPEGATIAVRSWYQTYLGRPGSEGEWKGWIDSIVSTHSWDTAFHGISNSPEANARKGG